MSKSNKKHRKSSTPHISLPDGKTIVSSGADGAITIRQGSRRVTVDREHQRAAAYSIAIFDYAAKNKIGELSATMRLRTDENGTLHIENASGEGVQLAAVQLEALLKALEKLGCPMPERKNPVQGEAGE